MTQISTANYKTLLLLLAPFAPYISEELWHRLGNKDSAHNQKWPDYDEELIHEQKITLIIQINGRVRDTVEVEKDISEEEARALAISSKKIENWLLGKEIKKIVFVKGKLINIVVS